MKKTILSARGLCKSFAHNGEQIHVITDANLDIYEGEVFGLVYLEAMLANCITVASKNEGMDGIITNGNNGFLVNAGAVDELASLIDHIQNLDSGISTMIAENAYETACNYTDSATAMKYLESINSWEK